MPQHCGRVVGQARERFCRCVGGQDVPSRSGARASECTLPTPASCIPFSSARTWRTAVLRVTFSRRVLGCCVGTFASWIACRRGPSHACSCSSARLACFLFCQRLSADALCCRLRRRPLCTPLAPSTTTTATTATAAACCPPPSSIPSPRRSLHRPIAPLALSHARTTMQLV